MFVATADTAESCRTVCVHGIVDVDSFLNREYMTSRSGRRPTFATVANDRLRRHVGMLQRTMKRPSLATIVAQLPHANRTPLDLPTTVKYPGSARTQIAKFADAVHPPAPRPGSSAESTPLSIDQTPNEY